MAYLEPPALARHLINPLAMRLPIRSVATLTVVGRRTGKPHKLPVMPVDKDGRTYLVCPYGESDWVRNVRAAGTCTLDRHGHVATFRATEVPVEEREAVFEPFREIAGRVVKPYFESLPEPKDHPVFRLDPVG